MCTLTKENDYLCKDKNTEIYDFGIYEWILQGYVVYFIDNIYGKGYFVKIVSKPINDLSEDLRRAL